MPSKKEQKPRRPPKSRFIVADLYTDNETHKSVIAKMQNQEDIEFWAILHNMDKYTAMDYGQYIVEHEGKLPEWQIGDDKKEHWHCCFHCPNPRYSAGLAYELGLHDDDTHLFQVCHDIVKYTHYLWHDPVIWNEKYQYDVNEIFGNITGMMRCKSFLEKSIMYLDDRQYQRIFTYIDTVNYLNIQHFTKWLIEEGLIEFYEKHSRVIKPYIDDAIYQRKYAFTDREVKIDIEDVTNIGRLS